MLPCYPPAAGGKGGLAAAGAGRARSVGGVVCRVGAPLLDPREGGNPLGVGDRLGAGLVGGSAVVVVAVAGMSKKRALRT